jgi:hypothetical protein
MPGCPVELIQTLLPSAGHLGGDFPASRGPSLVPRPAPACAAAIQSLLLPWCAAAPAVTPLTP